MSIFEGVFLNQFSNKSIINIDISTFINVNYIMICVDGMWRMHTRAH